MMNNEEKLVCVLGLLELPTDPHELIDAIVAKDMYAQTLAEVSLEVAKHLPDDENAQSVLTRAQWRHNIVRLAEDCINRYSITHETEDIDEVVWAWMMEE